MANTIKSLTVVLNKDIHEEDVAQTMSAIAQIKNVLAVSSNAVTSDDYVNRTVIRQELISKLYKALE